MEKVYFFSVWWLLYLALAIIVSLLILIAILFPLGISISSDFVFGLTAMVSFLVGDYVFKKLFKKEMLMSKKIPKSLLYVLIPLCIFVMLFGLV